jgi:hypothetical protein
VYEIMRARAEMYLRVPRRNGWGLGWVSERQRAHAVAHHGMPGRGLEVTSSTCFWISLVATKGTAQL